MPRLDPEQRKTLRAIQRAPSWRRASPKIRKALIEAGLVEKNLVHTPGGDRDSGGFLQQRPSQGWGPATEDATTDAEQFLKRAIPLRRKYGSAGELAQAVQRSAFPARYNKRGRDAAAILRELGGGSVSRETQAPKSESPDSRLQRLLILRQYTRGPRTSAARRAALYALGELETAAPAKPKRGPRAPRPDTFTASSTDWGGAREVAEKLTRGLGAPTSTKRTPSQNARVGGSPTSDHLTTNTASYALDLPISRSAARTLAKRLGIRRYKWGQTYNVSRGGYRVQLIAGSAGHLDHIHVGVRRVGK